MEIAYRNAEADQVVLIIEVVASFRIYLLACEHQVDSQIVARRYDHTEALHAAACTERTFWAPASKSFLCPKIQSVIINFVSNVRG